MALETWTFDVCTNTWTLMGQPDIHGSSNLVSPALVYDADSDIVVAIGALGVDAYDVDTDTWVRHGKAPSNVGDFNNGHAIYDPVSGLIVVRRHRVVRDVGLRRRHRHLDADPARTNLATWRSRRSDSTSLANSTPTMLAPTGSCSTLPTTARSLTARAPTTWSYDLRAGEWTDRGNGDTGAARRGLLGGTTVRPPTTKPPGGPSSPPTV